MIREKKCEGSVTVFFSLLFSLLFSFSLTFYQAAAEAARSAFELSAAKLSTESFFAAYHYPLYELYHIFGREMVGKAENESGEAFMQRLVMEDLRGMTAARPGKLSLLRREGAFAEIQEVSYLTDQDGKLFFQEAVAYMKYKNVTDFFRLFEEQEKETEKVQARLRFMEQKAGVDNAYAALEKDFVLLIELIDGVDLEKYEKYLGGKSVSFFKPYYVKYFSVYQQGMAELYFKREDIYASYQKSCVNPLKMLQSMQTTIEVWKTLSGEQMGIAQRFAEITQQEALLLEEVAQNEIAKEELEKKKELLKAFETEKKELNARNETIEKEIKSMKKVLYKSQANFLKQCDQVASICMKTKEVLERMDKKLAIAKGKRSNLQYELTGMDILGEDEIAMWQEELKEYDCYEKKDAYDFEQMKHTIEQNYHILMSISNTSFEEDAFWEEVERCVFCWKKEISKYSFDGLVLEYGEPAPATISLKEAEETVSQNLKKGLLYLLLVDKVSEAVLEEKNLPSKEYLMENKELKLDFSALLSFDFTEGMLHTLQEQHGSTIAEYVSKAMLFQAYIKEHFQNYTSVNAWDGAVLQYEQEYLLAGEKSDLENLTQAALQIIMTRMALHFSSILTNAEKRGEAEKAAVALAGITGMPALKYVAVTIFLLIWALEEAIVDTAAFLSGKKLAVYPGPMGGCIAFSELLIFTRQVVSSKIGQMRENGSVLIGYTDYLQILLLAKGRPKLCYRALDLIQSNLQKNVADDFYVKNCIYGAKIKGNRMEWEFQY